MSRYTVLFIQDACVRGPKIWNSFLFYCSLVRTSTSFKKLLKLNSILSPKVIGHQPSHPHSALQIYFFCRVVTLYFVVVCWVCTWSSSSVESSPLSVDSSRFSRHVRLTIVIQQNGNKKFSSKVYRAHSVKTWTCKLSKLTKAYLKQQ